MNASMNYDLNVCTEKCVRKLSWYARRASLAAIYTATGELFPPVLPINYIDASCYRAPPNNVTAHNLSIPRFSPCFIFTFEKIA